MPQNIALLLEIVYLVTEVTWTWFKCCYCYYYCCCSVCKYSDKVLHYC